LAATGNERKQREMPGALDSDSEGALALRGQAGLAARFDLAPLGKEAAQAGDILVINLINAIGGEDVHPTATATTAAEPAAAPTAEAAPATATTEPAATAAAFATKATATATAITTEAAPATTVATTIIGTGGAVLTWRTIVRCPLRALLISHGLFLLKDACWCA
jgi:hypothetical protein